MSTAAFLSVFAFLLISNVQQTKANGGFSLSLHSDGTEGRVNATINVGREFFTGPGFVEFEVEHVTTEPMDIIEPTVKRLNFSASDTQRFISVAIVDDTIPENREIFGIRLVSGNIGQVSYLAVFIIDNDFYTEWSDWVAQACSVTCGLGNTTETRTRTCIALDHVNCPQPNQTRSLPCNYGACPVITQWYEWADNGTCSTTCGSGSQIQSRTRNCTGLCSTQNLLETRTVMCSECACPASTWSRWSGSGRPNGNKRRRGWKRKRRSRKKWLRKRRSRRPNRSRRWHGANG